MDKGQKFGHFKIIKEISAGGAATIYLAENTRTKSKIALKVVHDHLNKQVRFRKRFVREVKFISHFRHENLIHIIDSGEVDGKMYLELEYFDSVTLREWIVRRGKANIKDFYELAVQMTSAVEVLHKKNIIHRDLSYENILVNKQGQVKITDFGLIKILPENSQFSNLTELTEAGSTFGTLPFMSPEQCDGREADDASDIYSLGINFYYMLTGKLPFENKVGAALISSICREEPDSITAQNRSVPYDLENLVMNMLRKKKRNRIGGISEILFILEEQREQVPRIMKNRGKNFLLLMILFALLIVAVSLSGNIFKGKFLRNSEPELKDDVKEEQQSEYEIDTNIRDYRERDFSSCVVNLKLIGSFSSEESRIIKFACSRAVTLIKGKEVKFDIPFSEEEYNVNAEYSFEKRGSELIMTELLRNTGIKQDYRKTLNLGKIDSKNLEKSVYSSIRDSALLKIGYLTI